MSAEKDLTAAEQKAISDKANKLINLDKLGNIDEPMADIAKTTTAGAEKESTNSINKTGRAQRDKFDADFEVAQVVREQKESQRRSDTVSYKQSLDTDLGTKKVGVPLLDEWVYQNTFKPEIPLPDMLKNGFDLESSIFLGTDWTDMSYAATPGPWRDEFIFGGQKTNGWIGSAQQSVGGAGRLADFLEYGAPNSLYLGNIKVLGGLDINVTPMIEGWRFDASIASNSDKLMNSTPLVSGINNIADKTGKGLNFIAPVLSYVAAEDYGNATTGTGIQQSVYDNKVRVDAAMAFVALTPAAPLTAGYGVLDLAYSFLPVYTAKHGPYKGEAIEGGWHNAYQREVDQYVDLLDSGEELIRPNSIYHW